MTFGNKCDLLKILFCYVSAIIVTLSANKVHFPHHYLPCDRVSQWISVYANDCSYFDQFVQFKLLPIHNITTILSDVLNAIHCIESTNSAKQASDACLQIDINNTICGAYQHFWYYTYDFENTNLNHDSYIDFIIAGSDQIYLNSTIANSNYNQTNYSYSYSYSYSYNLKSIHYTQLYNTTTLLNPIDSQFANKLKPIPFNDSKYSETTSHIFLCSQITLTGFSTDSDKQMSKIQNNLPPQCTELMYLANNAFQKNAYTILSLSSDYNLVYNFKNFTIESVRNNLTQILLYFAKDSDPIGNDFVCLNYLKVSTELQSIQHFVLTFIRDDINFDGNSISFNFQWNYAWYQIENDYLHCSSEWYKIFPFTSSSGLLYPVGTPSDYFDKEYKTFDIFLVNLSDMETLLCIVISLVFTTIFVGYGLSKHATKEIDDTLNIIYNATRNCNVDDVITLKNNVLKLHKSVSIYQYFLIYVSIISIYLYIEYFYQINVAKVCLQDEILAKGLVIFEQFCLSTLTGVLLHQMWNLKMISFNSSTPNRCLTCHEKCFDKRKHDIYIYKYIFIPGWMICLVFYGGALGSGLYDYELYQDTRYAQIHAFCLLFLLLLVITMEWQEIKFYQSFDQYFNHKVNKKKKSLKSQLFCGCIAYVVHTIKHLIIVCTCFTIGFYCLGPFWIDTINYLDKDKHQWLYALIFLIPSLLLLIFLIRPIIFVIPGCIMSKTVIVGWYYVWLFTFLRNGINLTVRSDANDIDKRSHIQGFSYGDLPLSTSALPVWIGFNAISIVYFFYVGSNQMKKLSFMIVSIFLTLLDFATDLNLIIQWFIAEDYLWFVIQSSILIMSQIIASKQLGNAQQYQSGPQKAKVNLFDRLMTLLGVGRAWMGCKTIGDYNLYSNEYSVLKIYEIGLESIPTMILQVYVALITPYSDNYDDDTSDSIVTLLASIGITFISISYSIFRMFDKHTHKSHSKTQNKSIMANIVALTSISKDANQTNPHGSKSAKLTVAKTNRNKTALSVESQLRCHIPNLHNISSQTVFPPHSSPEQTQSVASCQELNLSELYNDISNRDAHDHDINIVYEDVNIAGSDDSVIKQTQPIKSDDNIENFDADNEDIKIFSKWTKWTIFVFLLSDLYVRCWPLIFWVYLMRKSVYIHHNYNGKESSIHMIAFLVVIIVCMVVLHIVFTSIYQFYMVSWIKVSEYRPMYTNGWWIRIQDSFISFFSSIVNVLLLFPMKKFEQKNMFARYGIEIFVRLIQSLLWHFIAIILCLTMHAHWLSDKSLNANRDIKRYDENYWIFHYVFWILCAINMPFVVYIQTLDDSDSGVDTMNAFDRVVLVVTKVTKELRQLYLDIRSEICKHQQCTTC